MNLSKPLLLGLGALVAALQLSRLYLRAVAQVARLQKAAW